VRHNLVAHQPFRYSRLLSTAFAVSVLAGSIITANSLDTRLLAIKRALLIESRNIVTLRGQLRVAEQIAAPRRRALSIAAAVDRDAVDPAVVRRIESVAPPDVWLVSLDLSRHQFLLSGRAIEWRSIAAFTEGLSHVSGLTHVELGSLQARGSAGGYDFNIRADVAPLGPEVPR
jgi:Tfp pilus assembly protein PilN